MRVIVARCLTNQAKRPRADGAPAPPASGPLEREVRRHVPPQACAASSLHLPVRSRKTTSAAIRTRARGRLLGLGQLRSSRVTGSESLALSGTLPHMRVKRFDARIDYFA